MISSIVKTVKKGIKAVQAPGKALSLASQYPVLDRLSRSYACPGRPAGLSSDQLHDACDRAFGASPIEVSHQHVSGWKETGAYRLFVRTEDGARHTLVFKNDVFNTTVNPALDGFPMPPGPPEYGVYRETDGPLQKYLPRVFLCEEAIPGRHYRYVLEDLRYDYRRTRGPKDILRIIEELPAFHRALRAQWPTANTNEFLLKYRASLDALLTYYRQGLSTYAETIDDPALTEVLEQWSDIERTYLHDRFQNPRALNPIHGDPNVTNVHRAKKSNAIKFVDWEWAGAHLMHADLASVLKGTDPDLEKRGVSIFAERNEALSADEHWALYHYCQMERGLLDASYVASIELNSSHQAQFDLRAYVHGASRRVLRSLREVSK